MTRLKPVKLNKRPLYAQKKTGSPAFLVLGQLPMWFLGRFIFERFRSITRVRGLTTPRVRCRRPRGARVQRGRQRARPPARDDFAQFIAQTSGLLSMSGGEVPADAAQLKWRSHELTGKTREEDHESWMKRCGTRAFTRMVRATFTL